MLRPLSIFAVLCTVPPGSAQTRGSVPDPSQLHAADFPGNDLSARIAAALTALGGTAAHPVERATIHLEPGEVIATRTIVLPNSRTAPFVRHVELHCHGAVLAGADPDAPVVHILPENSNGGQSGTVLRGCTVITPAHGPAVLVDSAVSAEITQNRFVGGAVQLKLLNTMFEDGATPGYAEQHSIHANDFENPSVAGVELAKSKGTDSMEYGAIEWSNHFQLPCGAAAIQVDSGITIQGGKLGGRINTTPSPCTPGKPALAIRKEGAIYRGTSADFTGEDTGGLGTGNLFLLGGSGPATLETRTALVTGMSYKQSSGDPSHLTMPYFTFHSLFGEEACTQMSDEGHGAGYVLQRKGNLLICQNRVRLVKGAETDDSASLDVYHFNNGTQFDDTGSVSSTFRAIPGMGVAMGSGFSQVKPDGTCPDPAGCIPSAQPNWLPATASFSTNGSAAIAVVSVSDTRYRSGVSFGFKRPGGTHAYTELWSLGVDAENNGGKDFYLYNKASGHTPLRFDADDTPHFSKGWSGTCASGHALIVTDGVVTGCK